MLRDKERMSPPLRRDGYRHIAFLRRAYSGKRMIIRDSNSLKPSFVRMVRRQWHCNRLNRNLHAVVDAVFASLLSP